MKKYITDNELLSAYIDGELSVDQKNELEQRLAYSPELQKKLDELQKIKSLTKDSIKEVPESAYFETRFFAALKSTKAPDSRFKKLLPALGFAVLTVALMLVLKFNPTIIDRLVEEQKTNIAGFYKENLRPLLFASNLSNEDIFNFAFSNRIPLDENDQQMLQLGYDDYGKEFFEIRSLSSVMPQANNLDKFVQVLKLNDAQKKQVDSILESYADELQTQILVNDKNTVAINPNLWNYNKAIAAELLSFASDASEKELKKILPAVYSFPGKNQVKQYVTSVKSSNEDEYIFFTPDTIFTEAYHFDKGKFKVEIQKMRKELNQEMKSLQKEMHNMAIELKLDSSIQKHRKAQVRRGSMVVPDSNSFRVFVPGVPVPDVQIRVLDSLNIYLDDLTRNLENFSFKFETSEKGKNKSFNFRLNDSSNYYFNLPGTVDIPDLDSLFKNNQYFNDSLMLNNMNYFFKKDSSGFRFVWPDSLGILNNKQFREQMKMLEEEMKEFREEMKQFRKDLKPEKEPEPGKKTPIEI